MTKSQFTNYLPTHLFILVALWLGLGASHAHAKDIWIEDYQLALKEAQRTGKDILIDITGSDWCGGCIQLNEQVFSQRYFKDKAPEKFILLKIDYPNDKTRQSEALQAQNERLSKVLPMGTFPTLILMDQNARPYSVWSGYRPSTPENYLAMIKDKQKLKLERDQFLNKAKTLENLDRVKMIAKAVEMINPDILEFYQEELNKIASLDPNDSLGFQEQFTLKMALKKVKYELGMYQSIAQERGPEFFLVKLSEMALLYKDNKYALQQIYGEQARFALQVDVYAGMTFLNQAINLVPESAKAVELKELKIRVEQFIKQRQKQQ